MHVNVVNDFMKQVIFLLLFIILNHTAFAVSNFFSFEDVFQETMDLFPEKNYRTIRRETLMPSNWFYNVSTGKIVSTVKIGEVGGVNKAVLLSFDVLNILDGNLQGNMNFVKIPKKSLELIPFEKEGHLQLFAIGEDFIYVTRNSSDLEIKKSSGIEIPKRFSISFPLDIALSGSFYHIVTGGKFLTHYLIDNEGQLSEKKIFNSDSDMYRVPRMIDSPKYPKGSFVITNIYPEESILPDRSQILKIDESCKVLFSSENQVIGGATLDDATETLFVVLLSSTVKENITIEVIGINVHSGKIEKMFEMSQKIENPFDGMQAFSPWLLSIEENYIAIISTASVEFSGRISRKTKEWEGARIDKSAVRNAVYSIYNSGKLISILNKKDEKNPLGKFSVNIYDFDKK